MKSFLKTLASVLMVITAGGLMACRGSNGTPVQPTSSDSIDSDSVQPTTYNVSIPATISDDGTFADDKFVYIYNSTTGKVLLIDSIWDYERQCYCGALNLTDISADGKKCTIRGTLVGNISPNDSLVLLYDIDKPSATSSYCTFGYYCLDAAANKYHGAMAVATADNYDNDSMLTTKAPAVFQPLQSWFQFKFADENGKPLSVASLVITSDNYIFTEEYRPFSSENNGYCTNEIYITPKSPTDDYIYADIRFGERCTDADTLTFTVTDAEGNDYKGTKPVPKGGFKKGKRYIEPTAIRLTKHITRVKPTIDWNNVSEEGPSPTSHRYEVKGRLIGIPEGSYDAIFDSPSITISGKSDGYCFTCTMIPPPHSTTLPLSITTQDSTGS